MASGIINIPYAKYGTQFVTLWTSIDNVSVPANDVKLTSFSIAKTGYVFIGLVGFNVTNASSSGVNLSLQNTYRCSAAGDTVYFGVRNQGSDQARIKLTVAGLYLKV